MNPTTELQCSSQSVVPARAKIAPPVLALDYIHAVNLAVQQNAMSLVRELRIKNTAACDLRNLRCEISASPEIFSKKTFHVSVIFPDEEIAICDPVVPLNFDYLSTLSDTVAGTLAVEIFSENGASLAREEYPLDICAPDQWLGSGVMPELLAAFVTPNLEIVSILMSRVADELEKATGSPAIQGFQADKTRVYEICAAIYRAIHSFAIRYSNPPASFSAPGQKIRFPDSVCAFRLGTCLDLTLLFASVMEQCRLHPVILMHKGHAYIGCHLKDRYFHDIPMDDLQTIRKLVELDEFVVAETTCVCEDVTFAEAEAEARSKYLNIDGDFQCAIDVVRARYSGIRPLPLIRSAGGFELDASPDAAKPLSEEQKRKLQAEIDLSELVAGTRPHSRIERWRQKLLDLSLRNRLLNVRDNQQTITLVCADVTQLEDKIAANQTLTLKPVSELLGEKDLHDISLLRATEIQTEIRDLLEHELDQRRLWTLLSEAEMNRRLKKLYRQSKTNLEEGGVNTLFLGIGFLEWKVSAGDDQTYLAPILLLPVRLQRRSLAEGITISRIDEDTVVNVTLLELLRREHRLEIPGLDPLPTDASGVNVARVLQIFRQAVLPMGGWEVREEARLGSFSFDKFIMWNDLTNRVDTLKEHPLVRHLVDGGGLFDDGIEVFPPEKIGENLNPATLFCPLNADSSQLAAVRYSEMGKNFVLHGPPGTGKSQTITNIIAHNLALGRRVLFVSEKKAALDVVHRRLCSVGLRPFCLELHSNKTGKANVLKQFAESLAVADANPPVIGEETAAELERSRDELNAYVNALHREYANGLSAYDCLSRIFAAETADGKFIGKDVPEKSDAADATRFDEAPFALEHDCLAHSREDLAALRRAAEELAAAFSGTTADGRDAFRDFSPASWTPQFEKTLFAEARNTLAATKKFQEKILALCAELDAPETGVPAEKIVAIAEILKSAPAVPATFFDDAFPQTEKFSKKLLDDFSRREKAAEKLTGFHLERLPELDCDGIERRLRENETKFFLARMLADRALVGELATLKKTGSKKLSVAELSDALPAIREFCTAKTAIEKSTDKAKKLLDSLWGATESEPERAAVEAALETAGKLHAEILAAVPDAAARQRIFARLGKILPEAKTFFAEKSDARARLDDATSTFAQYLRATNAFAENFAPRFVENAAVPAKQIRSLEKILANAGELRRTLMYLKKRYAADICKLQPAVNALEAGVVSAENFVRSVEIEYCRAMIGQLLAAVPVLGNFIGENRNAEIQRFRALDARQTALSGKIVFARLAAKLPRRHSDDGKEGTELGILRRECEKRARQKPVRQLLAALPKLVPALKPCFLMSPLSVAQYLSPDAAPFDLVIFDEASQIPVWDAIGAIARGKQLIVVGDPKQMPPTAFFRKTGEEETPDETAAGTESPPETLVEDDAESILDECIAAGVFSAYLNWHYRSRHESLISFSNRHYYDNRLLTFPSARRGNDLGVKFVFVENGVYDRCGKRTNRVEAEALVSEIFAKIADPAQRAKSVGVVAFSEAQRNMIEDLVEKKRAEHPEFDAFFNEEKAEPFFVKNLENVQGDERDVIYFSVGYAPDSSGFFSMNFGPLNRQGGERRLNVAITRAKEKIVVFSSIRAEQINLSRTHADGARHLKFFLEYAERNVRAIPGGNDEKAKDADGLSETIAALLESKGYAVRKNIGNIDVAVLRAGTADEFLLGIECDGRAYGECRTARDRDRLREEILASLGWRIFRAWSIDWAFDRAAAEKSLFAALAEAEKAAPPKTEIAVKSENPAEKGAEQLQAESAALVVKA